VGQEPRPAFLLSRRRHRLRAFGPG
jgi:hypothetical protein